MEEIFVFSKNYVPCLSAIIFPELPVTGYLFHSVEDYLVFFLLALF